MKEYDWSIMKTFDLDKIAQNHFGTERRIGLTDGTDESDAELRRRLVARVMRFQNNNGSFYDIVHDVEQLIHRSVPVGIDDVSIRRQVGLGLISKNKTGNWLVRLKTACKAFWSCM